MFVLLLLFLCECSFKGSPNKKEVEDVQLVDDVEEPSESVDLDKSLKEGPEAFVKAFKLALSEDKEGTLKFVNKRICSILQSNNTDESVVREVWSFIDTTSIPKDVISSLKPDVKDFVLAKLAGQDEENRLQVLYDLSEYDEMFKGYSSYNSWPLFTFALKNGYEDLLKEIPFKYQDARSEGKNLIQFCIDEKIENRKMIDFLIQDGFDWAIGEDSHLLLYAAANSSEIFKYLLNTIGDSKEQYKKINDVTLVAHCLGYSIESFKCAFDFYVDNFGNSGLSVLDENSREEGKENYVAKLQSKSEFWEYAFRKLSEKNLTIPYDPLPDRNGGGNSRGYSPLHIAVDNNLFDLVVDFVDHELNKKGKDHRKYGVNIAEPYDEIFLVRMLRKGADKQVMSVLNKMDKDVRVDMAGRARNDAEVVHNLVSLSVQMQKWDVFGKCLDILERQKKDKRNFSFPRILGCQSSIVELDNDERTYVLHALYYYGQNDLADRAISLGFGRDKEDSNGKKPEEYKK